MFGSPFVKGAIIGLGASFLGGYVAGFVSKDAKPPTWAQAAGVAVAGAGVAWLLAKF